VARPREFDRDDALQAAIEAFWSRGFDGVGMEELITAMGIGRQSVYGAFGNKKALYLEALQAYSAGNVAAMMRALQEAPSPLMALRIVLLTPVDLDPTERAKGCFGINAICEFGQSDPDVVAASSVAGVALQKALVGVVRAAQEKGEVNQDLDPRIAAGLVQTLLSGVKIAARAGADPRSMRKIVDLALGALTPKPIQLQRPCADLQACY
jgi:TetR/AcrR family transcriptional repressor of nem operon